MTILGKGADPVNALCGWRIVSIYMYFGSVKFFKHLILTVVFGWIAAATILAVFFGVKCYKLTSAEQPAEAEKMSVSEYIKQMNSEGYTSEQILEYISRFDAESYEAFVGGDKMAVSPELVLDNDITEKVTEPVTSARPDDEIVIEDSNDTPNTPETEYVSGNADYTELYPELYAEKAAAKTVPDSKTVYMTFDDGPSVNTYDILFILNRQKIKGTFFMSAGKTEDCREQMRAVAEAGHTIGVHSFSHDPSVIYSSVEDFLRDFYETYKLIYDACGVRPSVYRMADIGKCPDSLRREIIAEMDRRGFTRFEYNAESDDRAASKNWQYIHDTAIYNVLMNTADGCASVVHLHDSTDDYTTVITTEDIIIDLKAEGYKFAALDNSVDI